MIKQSFLDKFVVSQMCCSLSTDAILYSKKVAMRCKQAMMMETKITLGMFLENLQEYIIHFIEKHFHYIFGNNNRFI